MRITEQDILDKGLNYLRTLETFEIEGNHYFPYPSELSHLKDEYNFKTEYYGSSDQGSTKTVCIKKPSEQVVKEKMQIKINEFSKLNNIVITDWKFL